MPYRTRVFIDFWNFSLNWRDRADGARIDWPAIPRVLIEEARKKLEVAGITGAFSLRSPWCTPRTLRVIRSSRGGSTRSLTANPASTSKLESGSRRRERSTALPAGSTLPRAPVISNVTAQAHESEASIRTRLVDQLTSPVRWSQSCQWLGANVKAEFHELAPGKTLAGLMRRIDKNVKVTTHEEP